MTRPQPTSFESSDGHQLAAILDWPQGQPRAYALFAHCFTCSKDLKAAHWIGRTLAERGLAMLRFDFAGLGQSEGEFADSTLSGNVQDLVAAAGYLRREYRAPALLIGHSLGGVATLAAAASIPEARAVCTISTALEPTHLRRYLVPAGEPVPEILEVTLAGRSFRLRRSFIQDLERHDMPSVIAELGRPLLVLHAPTDRVVEVEQAEQIFAAARQPKSFIALDGADHLLSQRAQAQRAGRLIAAWTEQYL